MTEETLFPVKIRPQLVPFLFKEFDGKEAAYDYKRAKSVMFLPSSSITSYLYTLVNFTKTTRRQDKFLFWLTIDEKFKKSFFGEVYIDRGGVKEPLMLNEQQIKDFNNLLEDIFRVALEFHVDALVEFSKINPAKAIQHFIDKYELYEVGFDVESLRVLYHRQKKTPNLFRFQSKSANRVLNYSC